VRRLLACKPQECSEVHLWLSSKGINAERVQQMAPIVMTRDTRAVQTTFESLQQAAAFSDAQMCALLHKHPVALVYGPERVLNITPGCQQTRGHASHITYLQTGCFSCRHQTIFHESGHSPSACDVLLPDVCHWDPCQGSAQDRCVHNSRGFDANQSSKASRGARLG